MKLSNSFIQLAFVKCIVCPKPCTKCLRQNNERQYVSSRSSHFNRKTVNIPLRVKIFTMLHVMGRGFGAEVGKETDMLVKNQVREKELLLWRER